MAILQTAVGCMVQVGFRLPGRTLGENDRVCFRAFLATEDDEGLYISEQLASDGTGTAAAPHVTLSYDLAGKGVLPGRYTWELTLLRENDTEEMLLPRSGNRLLVEPREVTAL